MRFLLIILPVLGMIGGVILLVVVMVRVAYLNKRKELIPEEEFKALDDRETNWFITGAVITISSIVIVLVAIAAAALVI